MEDIKNIVARNIVMLRKKAGLTQMALATKISYSDKAISRWESGEVTPDVDTLHKLSKIFKCNISLFFEENLTAKNADAGRKMPSKLTISLLAICLVWILATLAFVIILITYNFSAWQIAIYATTISLIVAVIFACIWSKNKPLRYVLISAAMWSVLVSLFIIFMPLNNVWPIFIFGVPMQAAILMWTKLIRKQPS